MNETIKSKLKTLPQQSGVYIMKNNFKKVIYVGKAINLNNRVKQYFQGSKTHSTKTKILVSHIEDFETIVTKNEVEALILECNLIKKYRPKYNILLKDDKTYPYLKLTLGEDFPRLIISRRVVKDRGRYFGPYTNTGSMKETIKLLRKLFPLRTCKNMGDRPCLEYHIKRCFAPCVQKISQENYKEIVKSVELFLDGKNEEVEKKLTKQMTEAADQLDFELAAKYRDQLQAIKVVMEKQKVLTDIGDLDAIGMSESSLGVCIQVFFVRQGKVLGRNNFFLKREDSDTLESVLNSFVKQYYNEAAFIPKEILLPIQITESELITDWLTKEKGSKVNLHIPQRGTKYSLINMATENAERYLHEQALKLKNQEEREMGAVYELQKYLGLKKPPYRMECFDISHIQGSETVASMVVFENGKPDKSSYRRFKINSTEGKPDDFMSMREVTTRRYGKTDIDPLPDLIIIDGGKGQLSSAVKIIRGAGHLEVPIVGLAKQFEWIFREGESDPVILPRNSGALFLIQQIRDESHRFAITYHRKLRTKRNKVSILDNIPGIGPKRRKALYDKFGDLESIKKASLQDLQGVSGITTPLAKKIIEFFNKD